MAALTDFAGILLKELDKYLAGLIMWAKQSRRVFISTGSMDSRKVSQAFFMDTRKSIHRAQAADCFFFVAPVTDFSQVSSAARHREII